MLSWTSGFFYKETLVKLGISEGEVEQHTRVWQNCSKQNKGKSFDLAVCGEIILQLKSFDMVWRKA